MMFALMLVLHLKIYIVLAENKNQGKYHLLIIFLVPGFLISLFLSNSWWVPIIYLALGSAIVYYVFKRL